MNRDRIVERYKKKNYWIVVNYWKVLDEHEKKGVYRSHLSDSVYHQWVNLIQTALMIYGIRALGKLKLSRKAYRARRKVEKFEEANRVYTGIFEQAERMFL